MRPDYVCYNGCGYIMIEDMEQREGQGYLKCPNCKGTAWYIKQKKEEE